MENLLSNLIITKVHSASTLFTERNVTVERVNRPCWAVALKFEGETEYFSGERRLISNAENSVLLPKGSSYRWHCTRAGHYAVVEFECDAELDEIYSFPVKNTEKLRAIFRSIEDARLTKRPLSELESLRGAYAILIELLGSGARGYSPSSKEQRLAGAVEYIAEHYTERLTNARLAELSGLSEVYFRRLFSEVYGISPINYLIDLRIKKAREMLESDFSSISAVASSLGYASIYDFSRDFKRHVGVSPTSYAKRLR